VPGIGQGTPFGVRLAEVILGSIEHGELDPVKLRQIAINRFAPAPEDIG
jgi:hypothetical protein